MPHSHVEIYFHFVWATRDRMPFLERELERKIHRQIFHTASQLKCRVIAINGMPDHIHLLVRLNATTHCAYFMQRIKGQSSRFANAVLGLEGSFDWQRGYAAFSVGRSELEAVRSYVRRQKKRHQSGDLWDDWEQTSAFEEEEQSENEHGNY